MLGDYFRLHGYVPVPWRRLSTAPISPTWVPVIIRCKPRITRPIEPVPRSGRIPVGRVTAAQYFVSHVGVGHWRAEVILRADLGRDFVAQLHRLRRCFDRDFKLRLLVFFHPEAAATSI